MYVYIAIKLSTNLLKLGINFISNYFEGRNMRACMHIEKIYLKSNIVKKDIIQSDLY